MKLYKHKAICHKCNTQEFDGAWITPDGHEIWIYVCYRCIKNLVLDNC